MIIKTVFLFSIFHYTLGYYFDPYESIYNSTEDAETYPMTNTTAEVTEVAEVQDGDRESFPGYKFYPEVQSWLKLHTDAADWQTARINCHDEDAVLAAPLNDEMHTVLKSMLSNGSDWSWRNQSWRKPVSAIYVAVQVNYPEGIYEYRNGVPVLSLGSDAQKLDMCAVYRANETSISWTNCQERLPYVCQAPTVTACGDKDYKLDSRTGQCYKFHTQCLPWNDAHRTCLDDGAHLAIANSQTEANVLTDIFAKYPFEALNGTHPQWGVMAVGFYYWKDADKYVTIFGQTIEEAGYAEWSYGNPSSRGKSKELGGGMFRSGLLDDVDKSYKVPFICEKKPIRLQVVLSNNV